MAVGDRHFPVGGGDYVVVTSSSTASENNASYFVDTTSGAITLTVGSGVDHFTVYDTHYSFATNNCTVDFGSSTTRVISVDGEIITFFKDASNSWRYLSVSVGNGGSV